MDSARGHGLDLELEPHKFRSLFIIFGIGALLLIWSAYGVGDYFIRKNADASLRSRLQSDSLVLEDQASRTLDAVAT
ncbi:MAG: hypothetical protein PHI55_04965, partial [Burkholderiaceae bacterium]|nr:hypothetical protein [Burkholderiaceae bacterium]